MLKGANAPAIAFLMASNLAFVVLELFAKQLVAVQDMNPMQILWIRAAAAMVILPMVLRVSPLRLVRTRHPAKQTIRSLLMLAAGLGFFFSLQAVPLADAVAIVFVSPLLLTAIAAVVLGEMVGWRRWSACCVGFAGALLIIQPGMEGRHWMYALPLIDAACSAVYSVLTRLIGRDDPAWTSLYYTILGTGVILTAVMPFIWIAPSPFEWLLLIGISVTGLVGHFFHIRAFVEGEASLMAPLTYIHVVLTTVAAFAIFGTLPDSLALVGIALIVGSGLYVLHRETLRARAT
ncbi:MAG: DMT family transporter [Alphaproteobacteria bacterium]|nr:DMT family transporter [Alphaproteobacteria bacterium]